MRTSIVIDDELMDKALKVTGLKTKRAVVETALRRLVDVHSQIRWRKLRGRVRFDPH
jgi:Arc/MetJ family transcription regulator